MPGNTERECPLCGAENACGIAEGKSTCWCMGTTIPAEVLDRIPAERKDLACICERCAAGSTAEPPTG
jgi:hypothetical protein